ncbi:MAG: MBL fold metallo-hydrolase [Desulfuromonadaceae bacterium]|nr:MBL fold metallo-hydrolase [Desulfuromonadaceae bacterium]MDD5107037.1 MBL fold metallo-hydrolase [Desulfuromonadaceae bacterium]
MANDKNLIINKIQKGPVCIHCCASPDDGERVNAQVVETENKLIIIDTMLMRPYARELRQYADSIGKPIDRVYITHAHPDHWFGMEFFQDVKNVSLPETVEEIKMMAQLEIDFHRSQHGDLITDKMYLPVPDATEGNVEIDGVVFRLHKIVAAEDLFMLAIDLPEVKTLIAQDLIYNKVHLFVGQRSYEGTMCFDGWINALKKFMNEEYELVLPGHGVPTDASVFLENIHNLEIMRGIVESSNGENFVQNALEAFPEYGLRSMIEMSAFFLFQMK